MIPSFKILSPFISQLSFSGIGAFDPIKMTQTRKANQRRRNSQRQTVIDFLQKSKDEKKIQNIEATQENRNKINLILEKKRLKRKGIFDQHEANRQKNIQEWDQYIDSIFPTVPGPRGVNGQIPQGAKENPIYHIELPPLPGSDFVAPTDGSKPPSKRLAGRFNLNRPPHLRHNLIEVSNEKDSSSKNSS